MQWVDMINPAGKLEIKKGAVEEEGYKYYYKLIKWIYV